MTGFKRPALACATVGIMAATLECVKLALAALPNVEAVTLFSAIFGYCFGVLGVIASLVFVMIEPLIWGFGSWFVTYLIYWPTLTAVFAFLGRRARRGIRASAAAPLFHQDGGAGEAFAEAGEGSGDPVMKSDSGKKNGYPTSLVIASTAIALAMTFLFGVLSSLIDVGLFSGSYDNFLYRFAIYYARGVWFYVAQFVTNLIVFPLLFAPLTRLVLKIKPSV